MKRLFEFALLLVGTSIVSWAGTSTPEIDASAGSAALALLSGGLLVLRTRKKK